VREGALAAVEQGAGEIIAGVLAVSTTIAFASGAVVIIAPGTDVLPLALGTLAWPIFPAEMMDIGLTGVGIEKLMEVG
jgi:hypothetical protein